MNSILEYLEIAETNRLEYNYYLIEASTVSLVDRMAKYADNPINKTFTNFEDNNVFAKMDETIRRLEAAKKALRLANRYGKVDAKQANEHKSRIMKNLNYIRGTLLPYLQDEVKKVDGLTPQMKNKNWDDFRQAAIDYRRNNPGDTVSTKVRQDLADLNDNPFGSDKGNSLQYNGKMMQSLRSAKDNLLAGARNKLTNLRRKAKVASGRSMQRLANFNNRAATNPF